MPRIEDFEFGSQITRCQELGLFEQLPLSLPQVREILGWPLSEGQEYFLANQLRREAGLTYRQIGLIICRSASTVCSRMNDDVRRRDGEKSRLYRFANQLVTLLRSEGGGSDGE